MVETETGHKDVEQRVRALIVELDVRWNSRDAGSFSRLFTIDHDFRIYGRRNDRDREALRDHYAQAWSETPLGVHHKSSVDTVRMLGAGIALVDGEVLVGEPDAPASHMRRYYYAAVVVLRDGEWLFDAFRVWPSFRQTVRLGRPVGADRARARPDRADVRPQIPFRRCLLPRL
jgi:uncharacterized protein (TIGR02246 family)